MSKPSSGRRDEDKQKKSQEELARSLDRELGFLAEERKDRARRLGIDGLAVSKQDS